MLQNYSDFTIVIILYAPYGTNISLKKLLHVRLCFNNYYFEDFRKG